MSEYYEELILARIKEQEEEEYEYMLFCENPPPNLDVLVKERLKQIEKYIASNKY